MQWLIEITAKNAKAYIDVTMIYMTAVHDSKIEMLFRNGKSAGFEFESEGSAQLWYSAIINEIDRYESFQRLEQDEWKKDLKKEFAGETQ